MKVVARVENAREIERALRRVADVGPEGLPRAAREALEPLLDELRRATPVDTGALRDSSRIAVSTGRGLATASVGWSGRRGRVRRAQMLGVEFGSRGRPGQRVLSSLFDAERDGIERRLVRALRAETGAAWGDR